VAKKATASKPTKNAKSAPAPAKATTTTLEKALKQLESLGNEATRKQNAKWAAGGIQPGATQFGVKHGDIRALAKTIGPDRALAVSPPSSWPSSSSGPRTCRLRRWTGWCGPSPSGGWRTG
jgi:hypothetical protein